MDVLFWSGGKDAYLAYLFHTRACPGRKLKLLTTYTEQSRQVPHQQIPLDHIHTQAEALGIELITVGLPDECPNERYMEAVTAALTGEDDPTDHLVFGDWYLQDIRQWREKQFNEAGYTCLFPLWQKPLDELLPVLLLQPVEIRISAVREEFSDYIRVGEEFGPAFIRQLPDEIDPMGERGEFHTEIIFKKMPDPADIMENWET